MNILIVSHHFWPEVFPINNIALELAKKNKVTILTGYPNYPGGQIFKNYNNLNVNTQKFKKTKIIRIPIIARKNGSSINLTLNYLSFIFSFIFFFNYNLIKTKPDVIFFYGVSPITSAIPAILLKKKFKTKLILWIQDLWPESILSTGHIKNKFLLKCLNIIINLIYKQADRILVQSKSFKNLLSKKIPDKQIDVLYNTSILSKSKNNIPSKLKKILQKNFCITFAGNIGKAQSFDEIIHVAKKMHQNSLIKFLIIGDGSEKKIIKQKVKDEKLKNIIFYKRVGGGKIWKILNMSDVLLITLKNRFIFNNTVPSKLQSYMSIGKPILGSLCGESSNIILKAKCGLVNEPENIKKLELNIIKFYNMNSIQLKKMGINAKKYFLKYFKKSIQIKKLIQIINDQK